MQKSGLRLSARYARILVIFVIWAGFGASLFMVVAGQGVFGGILLVLTFAAIAIAIDGRTLKERTYSTFDLLTQWLALLFPVLTISLMAIALGRNLLSTVLPFVLVYLLGIVVVLVMAFVELRKGVRV
ncbi:MAG TPA: hypothetical protein VJK02_13075 [Anaerolineales bacterium]|nr:hypothetical protein [Anaerolineales bacterium]